MPITLEQIVEETRGWTPEKIDELVGRLTDGLHTTDSEVETAWKDEINRRIEEMETGEVQGIPGEEVSAGIRKMLGR